MGCAITTTDITKWLVKSLRRYSPGIRESRRAVRLSATSKALSTLASKLGGLLRFSVLGDLIGPEAATPVGQYKDDRGCAKPDKARETKVED